MAEQRRVKLPEPVVDKIEEVLGIPPNRTVQAVTGGPELPPGRQA